MKFLTVVFSVLSLTLLAACSHFSLLPHSWNKNTAHAPINSSEVNDFLDSAASAAKDLALADSVSDWQENYDKVVAMRGKLPEEALTKAQQKECDGIVEQMEIGKLAIEMKRVDPKIGLKQCKLVSMDILKHIKNIKSGNSKA
jgi:hypothetical protein